MKSGSIRVCFRAPTLSPTEDCSGLIIATSAPQFDVEGKYLKLKPSEHIYKNVTDSNHRQWRSRTVCPQGNTPSYFYFNVTEKKWVIKGILF